MKKNKKKMNFLIFRDFSNFWKKKKLYCGAGQAWRRPGARSRPRYGQERAATQRWALRHDRGPRPRHDGLALGRWAQARACERERARGRVAGARWRVAGARSTVRKGALVSAATRQPGAATRPALAMIRPGQGP